MPRHFCACQYDKKRAAHPCPTELLDYGVRGLALDIYGDDENSLHLQHGHGNPVSATPWSKIHQELKDWLTANPREIVCLFFESYLGRLADAL